MAINLLNKLPLTYFKNGIEYFTKTNKPVLNKKKVTV